MTSISTQDLKCILGAFRASHFVFHRYYGNGSEYSEGHKSGYAQALSDIEAALCQGDILNYATPEPRKDYIHEP